MQTLKECFTKLSEQADSFTSSSGEKRPRTITRDLTVSLVSQFLSKAFYDILCLQNEVAAIHDILDEGLCPEERSLKCLHIVHASEIVLIVVS